MKFVALLSGGKDSIFALMESIRHGHELVGCVHLGAPHHVGNIASSSSSGERDEGQEEEESYMYQTAASEVLSTVVEECLGVPLIWHQRIGTSVNTSLVYQHHPPATTAEQTQAPTLTTPATSITSTTSATTTIKKDEVEDLYEALKAAHERFPGLEAVSSGAILSTYQRVRIENVCSRLGLTSISYLWRRAPQDDILREMIRTGIHAVLVKTACPPGLVPQKHLNKSIVELESYFYQLHDKYQFHVCGEGGEYETLVLDCPIYKRKLVLDDVEIVETEDGVGSLHIRQWHTEPKEATNDATWMETETETETETKVEPETSDASVTTSSVVNGFLPFRVVSYLPHVQRLPGGLLHLSEVMSPVAASSSQEADGAVQEALVVFQLLERALKRHGASPQDVVLVHLYLSEISHFALINAHYRDFFGTFLPPSRSCVAIGKRVLPGGRRVLLDCIVQCGSGDYLRSDASPLNLTGEATDNTNALQMGYSKAAQLNTNSKLREVLHVQSISHWAPTCVGPYSQANTIRSGLVFLAGQIGLIPTTMKLHPTWQLQLNQCWKNIASVLDALQGGSLDHMLSCLVYVSTKILDEEKNTSFDLIEALSSQEIQSNAGIVPGAIESVVRKTSDFGGYEDEQTMLEMKGEEAVEKPNCPLLLISIPEMPMGALVEVEVVAATHRAAACLNFSHFSTTIPFCNEAKIADATLVQWDTGVDFGSPSMGGNKNVLLHITSRFLGDACAASVVITANAPSDYDLTDICADVLLGDMMAVLDKFFAESGSGLSIRAALHIRLYYIGASVTNSDICDDGTRLRSALAFQTAVRWPKSTAATSVIPVRGMKLSTSTGTNDHAFLAMHVILADPVHLETETWIRHGQRTE